MKLVLFDIDGTILWTDGAGRRAIQHALVEVFGARGPEDHRFDGKTDPQIVREMMRVEGHEDAHIDEHMERLFAMYVERLRDELRNPQHPPKLFPGVKVLLDTLAERDDVLLGLLTGNLVEGARAKLESVGIDPDIFVIGAFGSDHELRPELPAIARQRAAELLDVEVDGRDIVVIGDTPADMTCGQAVGAKPIGVATGRYSIAELEAHGAHAAFPDLSDTVAVLAAILSEQHSPLTGPVIEVELKAVVPDLTRARAAMEKHGATLVFAGRLEDRRYDTPRHELLARDHVLRLRVYRAASDTRAVLDWKGPTAYDAGYKQREELSTAVADADALVKMLEYLGYEVTMEIDREIWQYELDGATIRFERYPRLDDLVEVEGAPEAIERAIARLGIPRSSFTTERLPDFVKRFEERTGTNAALSQAALAGNVRYDFRNA